MLPRQLLVTLCLCAFPGVLFAQAPPGFQPATQKLTPEQMKQLKAQGIDFSGKNAAVLSTSQPAKANPAKKVEDKKKAAKPTDKKSEKGKKSGKTPATPKTIQRPEQYEGKADPTELELRPNADGKLQFNFRGQPWPDILEWLADVSKCSLQWKELPGDFLTLTTRRSYSVDEARDMINQQLLSRGYTMLKNGELLYVVPVAKLNKAMIPRVTPDQLAERQANEFVRCSFKLEWMVAGDAVTELKPMLSEHGKLYQLASTNRIEAFDIVTNLRAINSLLEEEQSEQVEEGLVRQFVIKHRRAEEVMRLVQQLMGINPDNPAQKMSSGQMKQLQKIIAAAQKSGSGTVVRQPVPTVLVLNRPENSILVTAEPDKMKQIEQAIQQLDVGKKNGTMLGNMSRMKIYELNTYDPGPLVKLLEDLGELDPQTQLKVDEGNRSIMAYAPLADHLLIQE
ncbi:MAG: secretin N-terminal domain-containing protein, partial [Planctomycetaceae bacterium]